VLNGRVKEKDAWDLWFCLRHHPDGPEGIAEMIAPHVENGLVQEALACLDEKFDSPDHVEPTMAADFERIEEGEARARRRRDAYERVDLLLREVRGDQ